MRGGVAFVNLNFDVPIDPAVDFLSDGWQIEFATCAQLVNYPDENAPAGSQLQPEVAKSVDISSDGLTYTFRLRDDFEFSPPSNERVTADAFKRAFDRVRDPVLNSPGAPFFRDVVSVTSDGGTAAHHPSCPSGRRLPRTARNAVHVRGPTGHAGGGAVHADPVRRPLLHLELHAGIAAGPQPQSEL